MAFFVEQKQIDGKFIVLFYNKWINFDSGTKTNWIGIDVGIPYKIYAAYYMTIRFVLKQKQKCQWKLI